MGIDVYGYGGVYLKCTPRTYKHKQKERKCSKGHHGGEKFCPRCGGKMSWVPVEYENDYQLYDIINNEIDIEGITEEDQDRVENAVFQMPAMNTGETQLLGIHEWTKNIEVEDGGEFDILPSPETCNIDALKEVAIRSLIESGVFDLLHIIYKKIEVKFGVVITYS